MSMPLGTVIAYVGKYENLLKLQKSGWIYCNGTTLDPASYPKLFEAIGTAFGGNGVDSFNVPDLRGQFLRGVDDGAGVDPDANDRTPQQPGGNSGDQVGSSEADQFRSHFHTVSNIFVPNSFSITNEKSDWNPPNQNTSQDTSSEGGNETRPVNIYTFYLILGDV